MLCRAILGECMRAASAACSRILREARGRIVFPFSRGSARCSRRADGGSMCQSALPYPRRACSSAPRFPAGRCVNGSRTPAARYGTQRVALDCQRLAMDFVLPCRSGEGTPLTPEELSARRERCGAAVFFSEELCANYFSYTAQGRAHFVLFDTAETLRRKLRLGRERGMETAFLMYPEVSDLLPELLNA